MTSIDIQLDGDGCWKDLGDFLVGQFTGVALLPDASAVDTFTGKEKAVPAMTLRVKLPDGKVVLALVKLEIMASIVRGFQGRLEYLAEQAAAGKGDA